MKWTWTVKSNDVDFGVSFHPAGAAPTTLPSDFGKTYATYPTGISLTRKDLMGELSLHWSSVTTVRRCYHQCLFFGRYQAAPSFMLTCALSDMTPQSREVAREHWRWRRRLCGHGCAGTKAVQRVRWEECWSIYGPLRRRCLALLEQQYG